MNRRIENLIEQFPRNRIDAFIVTKDVNITYLTGFPAEESWLLVTPKRSYYITDFRYMEEARDGLQGIAVKQYTSTMAETFFSLAGALKIRTIGFDDRHLTLASYRHLLRRCPKGIRLKAVGNLVENLREIKEQEEVASVREALQLHQKALQHIKGLLKPGITERMVLERFERFVKSHKAGFSFPPIIASGPHSALPHAKVSDRVFKNNEPVLIDTGIDIKGYKSDLTRMFFLGKIPPSYREIFDRVKVAQLRAIAVIRAGIKAVDVDQQARNYLKNYKLAKYFGHSLGHGVGLEIHESPRLSPSSTAVLRENMIVTVEPAVYLPHRFGIRIEDMVLVKQKGCEVLSANID